MRKSRMQVDVALGMGLGLILWLGVGPGCDSSNQTPEAGTPDGQGEGAQETPAEDGDSETSAPTETPEEGTAGPEDDTEPPDDMGDGTEAPTPDEESTPELAPTPQTPPADLSGTGGAVGDVAYDFNLRNQWGEKTRLYDQYGLVLAIDFGAAWAEECEVPATEAEGIYQDYKDQGYLAMMVVVEDEDRNTPTTSDLVAWADKFGSTFPILGDVDHQTYEAWSVPSLGTVYVIDRDMTIHAIMTFPSQETLRSTIEGLL